jgi:hypothetical protein
MTKKQDELATITKDLQNIYRGALEEGKYSVALKALTEIAKLHGFFEK